MKSTSLWRVVTAACLVASYVAATTYPFEFIRNGARRGDGGMIEFPSPGIIYWRGSKFWLDKAGAENGLVFRLEVVPFRSVQAGPARILTISKDHYHSNLTIAQAGRDLVVRLRREGSDSVGAPPFTVADVFDEGQRRDVVVAISKDSLRIRIDGRRALIKTFTVNPMSVWNPSFSLALGNEFTWERPWLGEIVKARVTMSDKVIDLLGNTSNAITSYGLFFLRRFQFITQGPFDALLNLIAMVPIGFLAMSVTPTARLSVVLGWWAGLCISVEVLQAFIVGRYPCFSDAALNVVGIAIGALLLNQLRPSTKHTKTPS